MLLLPKTAEVRSLGGDNSVDFVIIDSVQLPDDELDEELEEDEEELLEEEELEVIPPELEELLEDEALQGL